LRENFSKHFCYIVFSRAHQDVYSKLKAPNREP